MKEWGALTMDCYSNTGIIRGGWMGAGGLCILMLNCRASVEVLGTQTPDPPAG